MLSWTLYVVVLLVAAGILAGAILVTIPVVEVRTARASRGLRDATGYLAILAMVSLFVVLVLTASLAVGSGRDRDLALVISSVVLGLLGSASYVRAGRGMTRSSSAREVDQELMEE